MEVNYELKPEDFYQFSKENAPTENTHKPMVILYSITYLTFILADVFYLLVIGGLGEWNLQAWLISLGIRTVLCFVALFIVLGIIKLIVNQKAKEVSKAARNGLFCEHRIILTEKELIELTDVNISRYNWRAIGEIKELENFILIGVTMSSNYIIPKRYFQDTGHINNFLESAKQYQQKAENNFQLSHLIDYEKSLR